MPSEFENETRPLVIWAADTTTFLGRGVFGTVYNVTSTYQTFLSKHLNNKKDNYVVKSNNMTGVGKAIEDYIKEVEASVYLRGVPHVLVAVHWCCTFDTLGKIDSFETPNAYHKFMEAIKTNYAMTDGILGFIKMDGVLHKFLQGVDDYAYSTLRDYGKPQIAYRKEQLVDICIQLTEAMRGIHKRGYTHNDLHLENILYRQKEEFNGKNLPDIEIFVADFGRLNDDDLINRQEDWMLMNLDEQEILSHVDCLPIIEAIYPKEAMDIVTADDPTTDGVVQKLQQLKQKMANDKSHLRTNRYLPIKPIYDKVRMDDAKQKGGRQLNARTLLNKDKREPLRALGIAEREMRHKNGVFTPPQSEDEEE